MKIKSTVKFLVIAKAENASKFQRLIYHKGLSIKDVRSQGGVQCDHFSDKVGSSSADVCIFWCKKNFRFLENYSVSTRTGGLTSDQCGYFVDKRGQFYAILCGCLLWTPLTTFKLMYFYYSYAMNIFV